MKFSFRLLACAALVAAPVAASAQTASTYIRPKLLQPGRSATALAGAGTVTVQVFVRKNATFTVRVVKSTNPGDNAAAVEIAKSSKYKPATRDGKPVDGYFDYLQNFGGDTAAIGTGALAAALATIRAGKYDQAKSDLQAYLQTHPSDAQANTLLGVADTFGGDPAGATVAFDKAGTIPDEYKTLALQSYTKYATSAFNDKKYPEAIAAAGHAIALDPQSLQGYFVRGNAYTGSQNDAAAIADLQRARSIAVAAKSDGKTLASIAYSLTVAQLDAGQFGEAATSERDVARVDSARSAQLDDYAFKTVNNTAIGLANQGKTAEAVSRLESGANAFPSAAPKLIAQAANVLATDKKPDWDKVKAEAQKALDLDPNNGRAEYILGIASSYQKDPKSALDYMNKAKASSAYGSDPALAKQIDTALKQLNGTEKAPL